MRTSLIVNPYGVLITVVEAEVKRIYARAIHSAGWSQDVLLPENISQKQLIELSNNDVWLLSKKSN